MTECHSVKRVSYLRTCSGMYVVMFCFPRPCLLYCCVTGRWQTLKSNSSRSSQASMARIIAIQGKSQRWIDGSSTGLVESDST